MLKFLLVCLSSSFIIVNSLCPSNYTYNRVLDVCVMASGNAAVKGNFDYAFEECWLHYKGNLFSIHNAFQNSAVAKIGNELTGETKFWIGLDYGLQRDNEWTWVDKTPFDYHHFAHSSETSNCTILDSSTQLWHKVSCANEYKFVCYAPVIPDTSPVTTSSIVLPTTEVQPTIGLQCLLPDHQPLYKCQQGWQYFEETGYEYLVAFDMNFKDASAYCERQGGHLASIHSQVENEFVTNLCCPTGCQRGHDQHQMALYLTGGVQVGGVNLWADGTPFDYQMTTCNYLASNGSSIFISNFNGCDNCGISGFWIIKDLATVAPYIACKK